jgi:hypothetical protein
VVALESHAHLLLVLHGVLGATTVAVTTHLAIWMRRSLRGPVPLVPGVRWFATAALIVYAAQMVLGNLLYPSYKVHVRAEYLELASAQMAEVRLRREAHAEVLQRAGQPVAAPADEADDEPPRLTAVARAFDIKEHVVALALPLVAAACALAWAWRPESDGPASGRLLYAIAIAAALASWLGALVGLIVTSYRSVG